VKDTAQGAMAPKKATTSVVNSPTSGVSVADIAGALAALALRQEFVHDIPAYSFTKKELRFEREGAVFVLTPGLLRDGKGAKVARLSGTARDRASRAVKAVNASQAQQKCVQGAQCQ
jgi:hypothetical protein